MTLQEARKQGVEMAAKYPNHDLWICLDAKESAYKLLFERPNMDIFRTVTLSLYTDLYYRPIERVFA